MSQKDVERFLEALEPVATEAVQDGDCPLASFAQLSTAISMKRIADALWGIEGTSGLLQLLNPLDIRNHF